MIQLLFVRFWPVLLPILAYFIWLALARRKAFAAGNPKPGVLDGPWAGMLTLSLAMMIACFLLLGFSSDPVKGHYVPAHMENGKLVPAYTEQTADE